MSLGNPKSILRIILLLNPYNLSLMIFRYNWFLGIAFLMAAFSTLVNPQFYIAIALLISSILLITTKSDSSYDHCSEERIKSTVILIGLVGMCLIVPQVETNMANFRSPTDSFDNQTRLV